VSEKGRIAAFFDLDGTVIVPPSLEFRFAAYLMQRGELRPEAAFTWLGVFLRAGMKAQLGRGGEPARLKAIDENKTYLRGVREETAREWAQEKLTAIEWYPGALERVEWHREQGHPIFLVSGTLAPLARAVAVRLGRGVEIGIAATELENLAGQWTGRVAGAAMCGPEKARAIRELAARHDLDLARSYAYGDSVADRWMLGCVGNATVVNPGARLMWIARRRGWRIARWLQPGPGLEIPCDAAMQTIATREKL
jgi:HAD superfamily hydrolase (TIGR01490 family)